MKHIRMKEDFKEDRYLAILPREFSQNAWRTARKNVGVMAMKIDEPFLCDSLEGGFER